MSFFSTVMKLSVFIVVSPAADSRPSHDPWYSGLIRSDMIVDCGLHES